jgi:hypothetical protein
MCKERHTYFPICTHSTYKLLPCRRRPLGSTRCPAFRVYSAPDGLRDQFCPDCRPEILAQKLAEKSGKLPPPPKKNNGGNGGGGNGGKIPTPPGSSTESTKLSPTVEEGTLIEDGGEDEEVIFDEGAGNGNGMDGILDEIVNEGNANVSGGSLKWSFKAGDDKPMMDGW